MFIGKCALYSVLYSFFDKLIDLALISLCPPVIHASPLISFSVFSKITEISSPIFACFGIDTTPSLSLPSISSTIPSVIKDNF